MRNFLGNPPAGPITGAESFPGIQSGADVLFALADLLAEAWDRDNHTGTQSISTIDGLTVALAAKLAGLLVKDEGSTVLAAATALNFAGSGVTVTDAGSGQALVTIAASSGGSIEVAAPAGVDDTAAVVAARTAAGAGGTVVFPASSTAYVVTGLAANVANQHWIIRPGATVKLKNASNTPVINVTASGVTIDGGGTLDGNKTNQTLTALGDVTGGPTSGVRIVGVSRCTVTDLLIKDCGTQSIYTSNSSTIRIRNNRLVNCGPAGNSKSVIVYDYYGAVTDVEIGGNTVDCSTSGNGCIAVAMYSTVATDIHIHHNRLLVGDANASSTLGIELFTSELVVGVEGAIRDVVIDHNVIKGPSTAISTDQIYGISVGGVAPDPTNGDANIVVSGNVIRNCPSHSIEVIGTSVAVTGNVIHSSGPIAVYANEVVDGIHDVSITGNTIVDSTLTGFAVLIEGSTNGVFGLVIANNTIRNPAGQSFATAGMISGLVIANNTVTQAAGVVVLLQGTVTDSTIVGNVFDLTGVGGTIDGIMLASTALARIGINSNTILGASRHGIYGLNTCADVSIVGNRITDCGGSGVYAAAAMTRWSVYANTITDNTDWGIAFSVASADIAIASNTSDDNPAGNYFTTGSTFLTHVINGAGG